MREPTNMELRLLNNFQLRVQETPVSLPVGSQKLLAFAAIANGPVSRIKIATTLWPDTLECRATANLRQSLWRTASIKPRIFNVSSTHIQLSQAVAVDLEGALGTVRRVNGDGGEEICDRDLELLLRGELLPDWDEVWLRADQVRFRELRIRALEEICSRMTEDGRYTLAIEAAMMAIAADAFRESARRCLMHVYLAEGNPGDAIKEYQRYSRLVEEELGIEASEEIRVLASKLVKSEHHV